MLIDSHPQRIVVEVTEHTVVDDYGALREALDELRRIGVRVAVDDLGTGSSNLDALVGLEPDIVKLDRVVTAHIDVGTSQRAIVRALRSLSSDVGATLIAEGVERKDQLEALLELGVRYGQGFFLGRPGPLQPTPGTRGAVDPSAQFPAIQDQTSSSPEGPLRLLAAPPDRPPWQSQLS